MDNKEYYLIDWPESQKYIGNPDCYPTNDNQIFVPVEIYKKPSKKSK